MEERELKKKQSVGHPKKDKRPGSMWDLHNIKIQCSRRIWPMDGVQTPSLFLKSGETGNSKATSKGPVLLMHYMWKKPSYSWWRENSTDFRIDTVLLHPDFGHKNTGNAAGSEDGIQLGSTPSRCAGGGRPRISLDIQCGWGCWTASIGEKVGSATKYIQHLCFHNFATSAAAHY